MNCPNCKAYNPGSASYCSQCGTALAALDEEARGSQEPNPGQLESQPIGGLRPGTVTELVARTFELYGGSFWVLVRIALVGQIPLFASVFVSSEAMVATLGVVGLFTGLLANAAAVYTVAQRHLGRTVGAAACYQVALGHGVALLVAFLVFALAIGLAVVLSFIIVGIPLLVFVAVAWFFYIQAIVIEGQGSTAALGRSWTLVRGTWWRVFGIGIVFIMVVLGAAGVLAVLPGLLLFLASQVLGNLLITVGVVLVAPLGYVGATLVYFDLRVRKEGYVLEQLASELGRT